MGKVRVCRWPLEALEYVKQESGDPRSDAMMKLAKDFKASRAAALAEVKTGLRGPVDEE